MSIFRAQPQLKSIFAPRAIAINKKGHRLLQEAGRHQDSRIATDHRAHCPAPDLDQFHLQAASVWAGCMLNYGTALNGSPDGSKQRLATK